MIKILWVLGFVLMAGGVAYSSSALDVFNLFAFKDGGSRAAVRDVSYGKDARQKLDVYVPKNGRGPWPVLVFVHGGSWQSGNKNPYSFVGRALAAQGFVTMVINYRLHPKHPYPSFIEDTALSLRWASQNAGKYGGNGKRLFVMGHSAGAYNAAMAVLDRRHAKIVPKISGVVTLAGPFDFLPLDSSTTKKVFGWVDDLPSTQPVNHVRADAPPFLILHGRNDTTVFLRNAKSLQKAFKDAGASATLKIYDDVSHAGIMLALSRPLRSRAPVLEDAVRFFRDRLQ